MVRAAEALLRSLAAGRLAQLVERQLDKLEVAGSSPAAPTSYAGPRGRRFRSGVSVHRARRGSMRDSGYLPGQPASKESGMYIGLGALILIIILIILLT